jgi:predicted anti-sigma-YlaC factor YlaD
MNRKTIRDYAKRRTAMFKTNEGTIDRVLRVAVGLALLVWFFVDQGQGFWHYAKLVGVVPLLTGLLGSCPVYSMFGLKKA